MAKTKRRSVLKLAGGAAAASMGGMAAILATGRMPAFAQQRTVHWLKWVDFVPATDALLKKEMMPEAEKALGIKINLETVNGNDLQPRITAGIQSGSGADLIMSFNSYTHLYANSVVDVSALAEEVGKREGGLFPYARAICSNGKIFMGMPWAVIGGMIAYRKSWFDEIGVAKFPDTWDSYREVAKKLKAKGRPFGQTLGHTFGDAPSFCYPLLWSFGGQEVDEAGKVVINSEGTHKALAFIKDFWEAACDPGGFAWDDTNNNRAFLGQTIGATLNGASIYFVAKNSPDDYPGFSEKLNHFLNPEGPAGRFHFMGPRELSIMEHSPNKEAAAEYIRWFLQDDNFGEFITVNEGYIQGLTPKWEDHPVWQSDPAITIYSTNARYGRSPGYAGPWNRPSGEAQEKYIIVDMFARAARGEDPEEVAAWGQQELENVYGA